MKENCKKHQLGIELWGRDDQTVQLKCSVCGAIVSVDSRDYDEEMSRMAEDDLDFDNHFNDDDEDE